MPIVATKDICGGEPRIEGHRITVANILGLLIEGMSIVDVAEDFGLQKEEVLEAVKWAKNYIEKHF